MPRGMTECPICGGKGKITEDTNVYDFVTRDPLTERCHICSGTGQVGFMTRLPNGRLVKDIAKAIKEAAPAVGELKAKKCASKPGAEKGSRKRAINPDAGKCADEQYELRLKCGKAIFTDLWNAMFMVICNNVTGEGVTVEVVK